MANWEHSAARIVTPANHIKIYKGTHLLCSHTREECITTCIFKRFYFPMLLAFFFVSFHRWSYYTSSEGFREGLFFQLVKKNGEVENNWSLSLSLWAKVVVCKAEG